MVRLSFLFLLFALSASAQKLPTVEEKTAAFKKQEGLLNFYWDDAGGKIWLEINKLDSELLYQTSLPAGLGSNDIGLDRGLPGDTRIIRFSKTGRKILMLQPNYAYRAVTEAANEKRAVSESFAQSTIWGFTVEAESNGSYLVDATDFFLRDAMRVTNRIRNAQQGTYSLDKTRSAFYLAGTKNFPLNTEIEASITFTNSDGAIGNYVQSVTPSADAITLRMHHSFVQLPDGNYTPRVFDTRSGFINTSYFDYSTPVSEPVIKKFIIRHRLEKKDPGALISEPVKPIIYYLDNGTPEPIRSALLQGAGWWNEAFEAAGFKNAFQVKILPDSVNPMDIRYNVINWVHRSTRGWSYGNAVVDPRTGEIIKGQVSLGSLRVRQDYLIAQGLLAPFGETGLDENGLPVDDKMLKMSLERLMQLSAHEVGHTIGLVHNYAASINNRASVMDYPHPMVQINSAGEIDLSNAYDKGIGEWDKQAINWGYREFARGTDEKTALNNILTNMQQKGLQFITDRDARAAGGLHPDAHLWDNGSNAVTELKNVMKIRAKALAQFGIKNLRRGEPMAMLEDVLVPVYLYHRYQLEAVTKIVGGRYYTYSIKGDGQRVTRPVSKAEGLNALNAIIDCIDPKVLLLPDSIARLIPPRPSGYDYNRELFKKRTGLAFDELAPAETAADLPLSFLFNSDRMNRMVQYEVQDGGLGLAEMLNILAEKTWKAPRRSGMEKLIQLQTEQVLLTYFLSSGISNELSFPAKATVQKTLDGLKKYIGSQQKITKDEMLAAHYLLALQRMTEPEKARPTLHKEVPPGAPIGCDWEE
jgi:Met-zincin/Domain of unknown function (DUF5117)